MDNPRVFISYSHDDEAHEKWVQKLGTDLRSNGIDAILDQFDLRLGDDLRFFMESGLNSSKYVICICSSNYVDKFDMEKGGAGYEGMILTQRLLKNATSNHIIPIIRNNDKKKIPTALMSKYYIDFSDDKKYDKNFMALLERLYDEDVNKKPPLGTNPFLSTLSRNIEFKTEIESILYHSPAMHDNATFQYDNNNGCYYIGNGNYLFNTKWSRAGNNSIYAYGSIGYKPGITDFPKVEEIISFDFSSNTRLIQTGQIIIFKNSNDHFAAVKLGQVLSSLHGNPYDEMNFEYHIYNI